MIISFKKLEEKHLPLLLKWLRNPHVKAWWDPDIQWTMDMIHDKFGSYVHGHKMQNGTPKPMHAYIICLDHQEIGYIQFYNLYDFPRENELPLEGLPTMLAALDIYIGEKNFIGKGWGSKIIQKFCQIHIDPHFEACFVDPDISNVQAIRAYEKAGFKTIKTAANNTINLDDAEKKFMSITFTTHMNSEWKNKIKSELNTQLETHTGLHNVQSQNIFAFHEIQLIGGVVFQKHGDILWIDALWVEIKFRRQGIGSKLIQQVIAFAKQHRIQSVQLNTYFAEARDFFASCEFDDVASIPEWKYGLTCYLMKKIL